MLATSLKRKVLIADDERLVRVGLRKMVDWRRWNLEVVAEAPNGSSAWDLYQLHRPDLVITDIVMPGMDGIELTRKIREIDTTTQVLFLSCHRDFAYAQQGIQLGVCGYVLKTAMGEEEVDQYLNKISVEWEQNASKHESENKWTFDDWIAGGELAAKVQQYVERSIPIKSKQTGNDDELRCGYYAYYFDLSTTTESPSAWIRRVLNEIETKLPQSNVLCLAHGQSNAVLFVNKSDVEQLQHIWVIEKIRQAKFDWKMKGPFYDVNEMLAEAEKMATHRQLEIQYDVPVESISEPIMEAIRFIEQNLCSLSHATQVADHVGLSRSHFSTVFKKEVGVSFLTYVHYRKLEEAKRLLRNTDWPIHFIADKIGMFDDKHFSKWFKKHVGYPPTKYRHQKENAQDV